MMEIKDGLSDIIFKDQEFQSPIAYAFMYVQWEANIVSIRTTCKAKKFTHFRMQILLVRIGSIVYRRPSLFADLVFAVLTIRGPENGEKTANSEGNFINLSLK